MFGISHCMLWRDYILRVASCQLRVASCQLRVASCQLRVASCQLRVGFHSYFVSCELRVASCELRVASCELVFHNINSDSFVPILDSSLSFL